MAQNNRGDKGSSREQRQQAANNTAKSVKAAEEAGYDKKLNGPNRPSI
ncbi:hypothetical protein [Paenibacillus sp. YIM B09110]